MLLALSSVQQKKCHFFGPNPVPLPESIPSGRGGFLLTKPHKPLKHLVVFFTSEDTRGDQALRSYKITSHIGKKLVCFPVAALKLASSYLTQKGDFLLEEMGIL